MKASIISRISLLFFAVTAMVSVTSCKDDHEDDGHGHMHVHFNNKFNAGDLEYDSLHTTSFGRKYTISLSQYYISDVRLVKEDGTEITLDSTYLLVKTGVENELEFEEIPAGRYTQLKFNVGVDSMANHADPSTYDATHPLASQAPGMHWSWNSGYIFFRLEGMVDTTGTPDGVVDDMYYYHLGTDAYLMPVSLNIDATVSESNHPGLNINLDNAALFNGIDLGNANVGGHGISSDPSLAGPFSTNIKNAFSVE